jgi:hypothetical protein
MRLACLFLACTGCELVFPLAPPASDGATSEPDVAIDGPLDAPCLFDASTSVDTVTTSHFADVTVAADASFAIGIVDGVVSYEQPIGAQSVAVAALPEIYDRIGMTPDASTLFLGRANATFTAAAISAPASWQNAVAVPSLPAGLPGLPASASRVMVETSGMFAEHALVDGSWVLRGQPYRPEDLVPGAAEVVIPNLTPDARGLLFVVTSPDSLAGLYHARRDRPELRFPAAVALRLSPITALTAPQLSADCKTLYFLSNTTLVISRSAP